MTCKYLFSQYFLSDLGDSEGGEGIHCTHFKCIDHSTEHSDHDHTEDDPNDDENKLL